MPQRFALRLAGIVTLALAAGLLVRHPTTGVPADVESPAEYTERRSTGADRGDNGVLRRKRSERREDERRAALDLAERIGEKQGLISSDHMAREGEKGPFPSALIEEAAELKAVQLRTLVRELGRNPEIAQINRALLVTRVTDAWLKRHEAGRKQSLGEVLEIIAEVLPTLPRGFDILPVSCAMGRSLEWDLPGWVDFLEAHWNQLAGPNGSSNAEVMRRDLLKVLVDPQLRMRVENLPQPGGEN